jgi:uncharacterized protein YjiS (DUF1127 family)
MFGARSFSKTRLAMEIESTGLTTRQDGRRSRERLGALECELLIYDIGLQRRLIEAECRKDGFRARGYH